MGDAVDMRMMVERLTLVLEQVLADVGSDDVPPESVVEEGRVVVLEARRLLGDEDGGSVGERVKAQQESCDE